MPLHASDGAPAFAVGCGKPASGERGARLIVFSELALTTFFPRWWMEDEAELDAFYETQVPNRMAPLGRAVLA